jgi:hypothetical protein
MGLSIFRGGYRVMGLTIWGGGNQVMGLSMLVGGGYQVMGFSNWVGNQVMGLGIWGVEQVMCLSRGVGVAKCMLLLVLSLWNRVSLPLRPCQPPCLCTSCRLSQITSSSGHTELVTDMDGAAVDARRQQVGHPQGAYIVSIQGAERTVQPWCRWHRRLLGSPNWDTVKGPCKRPGGGGLHVREHVVCSSKSPNSCAE